MWIAEPLVPDAKESDVSDQGPTIAALQVEERVFPPSDEFVAGARITDPQVYEAARRDLQGFWAEQAAKLDWIEPWDQVLDRSNARSSSGSPAGSSTCP